MKSSDREITNWRNVTARVFVRLTFAASQISLFQSRLAHAGYTAPVWPDSPATAAGRSCVTPHAPDSKTPLSHRRSKTGA